MRVSRCSSPARPTAATNRRWRRVGRVLLLCGTTGVTSAQYLASTGAADDGADDAASPWTCVGALEDGSKTWTWQVDSEDRGDFNGFEYDALAADEPKNSVEKQRERAKIVDYYGASITRMTKDWGFYEVLPKTRHSE